MPAERIDFFWDPVCPWAWITSRWVQEVASQRTLEVDWRFIALRIVNEDRDYARDFRPGYEEGHNLGLRVLRAAAALREREGSERVGDLYTLAGTRIHVEGRRGDLADPDGLRATLTDAGFPADLAEAAYDEAWDAPVRVDTEEALERTGRNVGTPIITFAPPDGPSFFGPVISRVPHGDDAVALWESVERLAHFPGFAELKRSARERPQTS